MSDLTPPIGYQRIYPTAFRDVLPWDFVVVDKHLAGNREQISGTVEMMDADSGWVTVRDSAGIVYRRPWQCVRTVFRDPNRTVVTVAVAEDQGALFGAEER